MGCLGLLGVIGPWGDYLSKCPSQGVTPTKKRHDFSEFYYFPGFGLGATLCWRALNPRFPSFTISQVSKVFRGSA